MLRRFSYPPSTEFSPFKLRPAFNLERDRNQVKPVLIAEVISTRFVSLIYCYSIEKISFLWCNAAVLRLNAPLVFVYFEAKGMVSPQLVWESRLQLCNLL